MIAILIATALFADATPVQPVAYALPHRATESRQQAAVGQLPYSVAVTLECTAHKDGRVGGCTVLGETDPGLGFGEAAIAMVEGAAVAPGAQDVQFARTIQFVP
ncbi:hypothetical protein BH10PSE2_BH10PSE2_11550 [soil metagenome]